MKQIENVKFEYLHRDESNYKTFSNVIFHGSETDLDVIDKTIKSKLISYEFFYPHLWNLPSLNQNLMIQSNLDEFHEYLTVSYTSEAATDIRSIDIFIKKITKQI